MQNVETTGSTTSSLQVAPQKPEASHISELPGKKRTLFSSIRNKDAIFSKKIKLAFKLPVKYQLEGEASSQVQQLLIAENRQKMSNERSARILERENTKISKERAEKKKGKSTKRAPLAPINQVAQQPIRRRVAEDEENGNPFPKFSKNPWVVIAHDAVELFAEYEKLEKLQK